MDKRQEFKEFIKSRFPDVADENIEAATKQIYIGWLESELEREGEKISLNLPVLSSADINKWCIENYGEEIMIKSQEVRDELYKFYQGCKFLAENKIPLQFKQV